MTQEPVLTVLAVDDDPQTLALVTATLKQPELRIETRHDPKAALGEVPALRPDVVLVDLFMPEMSGLDFLDKALQVDPGLDAIIMTANYSSDSAVAAIQRGASDYIEKPLNLTKLRSRVESAMRERQWRRQLKGIDEQLLSAYDFGGMIGRSPLLLDLLVKIRRVAPHYRVVLITGPTGSGKELVARSLYTFGPAQKKFATVNCSALVETLAESELFGHVRGAFTGAVQDKPGIFEDASGGVLFLDEVGELSLNVQAKLLRVLQNQEVQRVGSTRTTKVDVRVIAATHRNLQEMVREGKFREDLYYRLSSVQLKVPALHERREDLPLLVRHFIARFSKEYGKDLAGLTRRAQVLLSRYLWPGNIRELESAIGHGCMMTNSRVIDVHDLPEYLVHAPVSAQDSKFETLEEVQKRHALRVLQSVQGNKLRAAEILGISRSTLYALLAEIGEASEEASSGR